MSGFKISALVEKSDSFSFPFDGEELTGRYYKYKTRTVNYAKAAIDAVPGGADELPDLPLSASAEEIEARAQLLKARNTALRAMRWKWFADTIIDWNALTETDEPLPITEETFNALPVPFVDQFEELLNGLIDPKKSPKSNSGLG